MAQHLVVTAIGADRVGIVSQLARLVSDCNCNILDSRMAIFGNEFTFIMLLAGDSLAISKIEVQLPSLGLELDLLTMSKRTSSCHQLPISVPYVLEYRGHDRVGTLGAISSLLALHNVDIGSLRSETLASVMGPQTHTVMTVHLPADVDPEWLKHVLMDKLSSMSLQGHFSVLSSQSPS